MDHQTYKVETYIPESNLEPLREALNKTGALTIGGTYDNCMAVTPVTGYWRPLPGAMPYLGKEGEISKAPELKVEFCCRGEVLKETVQVIRRIHPYEQPVINIIPILDPSEF